MHRKFTVFVVALALLAGACGSGKSDDKSGTIAQPKRTTTSSTVTSDDATTTTAGGGTTATTKAGSATATTAGNKTVAPKSATTTDPNAVPGPAATGTYDYAQSGSTSQGTPPPRGTLVVSGSGPSQVFHRAVDQNSSGDLYMNFSSSGPFLTKVVLSQGGARINCAFGSPVPVPPWPPTTGRSFSGSATCDGGLHADFSGSITGRTTDRVGGAAVDTIVIVSTLHVTGQILGQPVDVTVKDTQHWAPSLRVPTYSHEVITGNATGDVTSTLLNTSPH
jgi:hypothetical protein